MAEYQFNPNQEQWKDIIDHPGYQVSDHGQVRSFWKRQGGHGWVLSTNPQRFIKQIPYVNGYKRVVFKTKHFRFVHRLVLLAFIGPCPNGYQCRHLDGNPSNNLLTNLCWGTPLENGHDRVQHGRLRSGINHPRPCSVLTDEQIIDIRYLHSIGIRNASLGRLYGVHRSAISKIILGNRWKHI